MRQECRLSSLNRTMTAWYCGRHSGDLPVRIHQIVALTRAQTRTCVGLTGLISIPPNESEKNRRCLRLLDPAAHAVQ